MERNGENSSFTDQDELTENSKKRILIITGIVFAVIIAVAIIVSLVNKSSIAKDYDYDDNDNYHISANEAENMYLERLHNQYAGDFIFYDSDSRYLETSEVASLSEDDIQMAINEIYARKGVNFENEPYASYFNSCEWYNPIYSQDEFDSSMFNEYEEANVNLLAFYRHNKTENGDILVNSDEDALKYAKEYANKEGLNVDLVTMESYDRGYTIRGYEDMGDHMNTVFLWTVEPNGDIYDEQNWAMYTSGRTYSVGLVTEQGKTAYVYAAWLEKDKYTRIEKVYKRI